jgi:hypothetical protein
MAGSTNVRDSEQRIDLDVEAGHERNVTKSRDDEAQLLVEADIERQARDEKQSEVQIQELKKRSLEQDNLRDELRNLIVMMKTKTTTMKLQMKNLHTNINIKMRMM